MSNNQLPAETLERIKADAKSELLKMDRIIKEGVTEESRHHFLEGIQEGYIAGATAVAERAQVAIDLLKEAINSHEEDKVKLFREWPQYVHLYENAVMPWIDKTKAFLQQWKEGKEVKPKEAVVIHNNSDAFRNWVSDIKGYPFALLGHSTGIWLPPGVTLEMFESEWEAYERANNPAKREVKP